MVRDSRKLTSLADLSQAQRSWRQKTFEQALAENKDDPDIYYHRAQFHFILGEFAEAAKDYQKSIDIDGDFIFSHIQLGVTQYKMGSIASSMATFRRCRKRFPQVPDVFNYYGELLLDQQKYQEALEQFDQAIDLEKQTKPMGMNVLPLINKALAVFPMEAGFQPGRRALSKSSDQYVLGAYIQRGKLTMLKSILNVTLQLLQWLSYFFNRVKCQRR